MTTISRRRPVAHATTTTTTAPVATANKLNINKEEKTMKTTIKLSINLETLTKAQKAALTTLGVSYKKPVENKEPIKKAAPQKAKKTENKTTKAVKKAAPVKADRMTIRSTSTDCLVAYNLCMIKKGNPLYDIDTVCKAAKQRGAKASTLMYKAHGKGMDFTAWVKRNVAFILTCNDIDIINACNGRQDLAESYIKAKG